MIPLHTAEQLARDWRMVARGRFWGCRSASAVRDAWSALWAEAAGAGDADLDGIMDEFGAALRRFGQGV